MLHIPLSIQKLQEMEEEDDPDYQEKKFIFKYLEKNLNFKSNFEIISMGIHGVVIYPSFSINNDYNLKKNYISKILDLHNEKIHIIEKEIQISKKLEVLDKNFEHFIYPSYYEKIDSYFYNIIMKKGFDFESNVVKLNYNQLLLTIFNLIESIEILSNNNILLLDIKPTNFLFNQIKNNLYKPVIIDFSGEFLIENSGDFNEYLNNFEFHCHDFWPIELTILLHRIGLKKKYNEDIVNTEIKKYNKILKRKLGNDLKSNTNYQINIYNFFLHEYSKIKSKQKTKLYEKLMIYQIGKSWNYIFLKYKKKLKLSKIQLIIMEDLIGKITYEKIDNRYTIQQFKTLLLKYIKNFNNSLIKIDNIL